MAGKIKLKKGKSAIEEYKAVVVFIDILNAFVLNLCLYIDDGSKKTAITAIVFFVFFVLVVSLVATVLNCKPCCTLECKCTTWDIECFFQWIANFSCLLGIVLYIFGDNAIVVLEEYVVHLGTDCGERCRESLVTGARIVLAVGTLLHLPPTIFKFYKATKMNKKKDKSSKDTPVVFTCKLLALIVDFDSLYTILSGEDCLKGDALKVSYNALPVYGGIFLLAVIVLTSLYLYLNEKEDRPKGVIIQCCVIAGLCVITCWCHLLADNILPLDCGISDTKERYGAKIGLSVVAAVCAIVVYVMWLIDKCCRQNTTM